MSGRSSMRAGTSLAAAAAFTTWVAMNSWRGFAVDPGGFLNPLLLLAAVVAGTGAGIRALRWPATAVVGVQLVVSLMFASLFITGSFLPVGSDWGELRADLSAAVDSAQRYVAPVDTDVPPIDPLLILSGLACLLIVDVLACTLRRVPIAGLPLLTVYTIPVGTIGGSISWWIFAATAGGFLSMLYLQESDRLYRWGRPLEEDRETGDPITYGAGSSVVRGTASTIGGVATALAVFAPLLVPTTGVHLFDFGPGSGGTGNIAIQNPVADLVRDLRRGIDTPLVRVTTTDPNPSYLRLLALTRFTDAEWTTGDRDLPADQRANGQMPPPQGVAADVSRVEYPYDVTVLNTFHSEWLPTQTPISRIEAEGDWRYDRSTMDFHSGRSGPSSAAGLQYTMTAVDLSISADRLEGAGSSSGKISNTFLDLPSDMPSIVNRLADEVTAGAATDYDKAVALQNWFREDGGFTYSLRPEEGSGFEALERFLSDRPGGRTGYCEQFAAAMAVMARTLDIPARVAIGFLTPQPAGPRTWIYSANDMHAWPELYFDGAGWVRFEPTPATRAEQVPGYTLPEVAPPAQPTIPNQQQPTSAAPVPSRRPSTSDTETAAAGANGDRGSRLPVAQVAGGLGAIALASLLLLVPRVVRHRRRRTRLASDDPEVAWTELHDIAVDLDLPWPAGRSPRAIRDALVEHLGAPVGPHTPERPAHGPDVAPEAVAALDRILFALELHRYARPGTTYESAVGADAKTCVASLLGGASRGARRRAEWWPRSVFSFGAGRRTSYRGSRAADDAGYGVVDQVGGFSR